MMRFAPTWWVFGTPILLALVWSHWDVGAAFMSAGAAVGGFSAGWLTCYRERKAKS